MLRRRAILAIFPALALGLIQFVTPPSGFAEASAPLSPLYFRNCLVAGRVEPGFEDGNFLKAAFSRPEALAYSKRAGLIYVADTGNDALRVVNLKEQNRVTTLVHGAVFADEKQGAGLASPLSGPCGVILAPDERHLYVMDRGRNPLKVLDIESGHWSNLPIADAASGNTRESAASMALDMAGKRLYFTRPDQGDLEYLDLPSGRRHEVGNNPVFSKGQLQLAWAGNDLFVFEPDLGLISRINNSSDSIGRLTGASKAVPGHLTLTAVGAAFPGSTGFSAYQRRNSEWNFSLWDAKASLLRKINAKGDVENYIFNSSTGVPLAGPGSLSGGLPFFVGPLALEALPGETGFFVLEKASNRLLKVSAKNDIFSNVATDSGSDVKLGKKSDRPSEKEPGVTRILWLGSSESFWSGDEAMDPTRYLYNQFEWNLNFFSALLGNGKKFEVIGSAYSVDNYGGSPASYLPTAGEIVDHFSVDEVVLSLSLASVMNEFTALRHTKTVDDIPGPSVEPDWYLLDAAERKVWWGPLTQKLREFLSTCPDPLVKGQMYFDANENLKWTGHVECFTNPGLIALVAAFMEKIFKKDAEFGKFHHVKITVCLQASANQAGEIRGGTWITTPLVNAVEASARISGLQWMDVIEESEMIDPSVYPMFGSGHFNYSGQHYTGMMEAWKYLKLSALPKG